VPLTPLSASLKGAEVERKKDPSRSFPFKPCCP